MTNTIPIKVENVSKTFKAGSKYPTYALKNVSFELNNNEITGLIGPNGAGKTTLLRIILGFLKPDLGNISIYGENPDAIINKKNIGFQADSHFRSKTVKVNKFLELNAAFTNSKNPEEEIKFLLETFHITNAANKSLFSLSKGMRQKIELVQSFIGNPKLVLLDEPTASLDPPSVFELRDFLLSKKEDGITVLFSSHNLSEVEKVCDRVLFINDGVVFGDYKMADAEPGFLEEAFRNHSIERDSHEQLSL